MPTNIAEDASTFPTQTAPVAGEPRTAGSVTTPFTNASRRTAWLKDRVEYIDPTKEGARRVRRVASVSALQAVTDLTDKGVIIIDGVGVYEYDAASVSAELSPAVIKPTSVGSGAGRWIAVSFGNGALNVANGIPQLDANGRVANARLAASEGGAKILGKSVVNGLVDLYTASGAGPFSTTSTTYVDVGSIVPSFTLEIGDRVILMASGFRYQEDLAATIQYSKWLVTKPDASTATVAQSEVQHTPQGVNQHAALAHIAYYTAIAAGAHTFKLQQKSSGGGGATVSIAGLNVVAMLIRP